MTFALLDQSEHWLKSNGGHRLARVLQRNAGKMDGRTLELANAHEVGEDSVVEQTAGQYEAGAAGVLFVAKRPTREPTPEMSDDELAALLREVYDGAPWVDSDRLLREVRDPGVPWSEIARFYFNVASPGTLAAVEPVLWDARHRKREIVAGERLVLGFDGSHARDATALVACTADGWLAPVEILERPPNVDDWRVDRARVQRAVEHMFSTYDVRFLYADPWKWQDEIGEWADRWPDRIVEVPTNSNRRIPDLVDRFRTALDEGRVTHDGDAGLRRHVLNARLRKVGRDEDGRGRYSLERAGPGRLIDGCVAAVLAYEASTQMSAPHDEPMIAWI